MMTRVTHPSTAAAAMALQRAAELRRSQASAAPTAKQAGAQYNFAEIFGGSDWGETEQAAKSVKAAPVATAAVTSSREKFSTAISTATAKVVTVERDPVGTTSNNNTRTDTNTSTNNTAAATNTVATDTSSTTPAAASAAATTTTAAVTTPAATTVAPPGVGALVTAIMNGSFKPSSVSDPSKLQETGPAGVDYMPGFYYASDQTATQLAQLLGGTVVQRAPFGQDKGWSEPLANFIQLPNGQSFNAADVAYYANSGSAGAAQLTADITATINQGSAWTNYYQFGGQMPSFSPGYVGPPISGMTYSANMIGADGNVINPAALQTAASGT